MLQEKRISSKINYEVLKSLDVGLNDANQRNQQPPESPFLSPLKVDRFNYSSSSSIAKWVI